MVLAVASIEAGQEISVDVSLCRMVSSSFNEFETKIPTLKLCYHCSTSSHLLDSGYVDAEMLVTAQTEHQIDVVGPTFGSYSRQRRAGQGYDLGAFVIEWEAQQARCP